ncbi:hypothetical protein [Pedobacter africanus]|uniref:hypothetical protein n=1 Tax=Pedobacter africanus TaxID=151894 RepID=UPI00190EBA45|nr:hypothetical protein [Pedobacter africanus]
MVELKSGRYDLAFKTDDKGRLILLFMGKKDACGKIMGERYARRLLIGCRWQGGQRPLGPQG